VKWGTFQHQDKSGERCRNDDPNHNGHQEIQRGQRDPDEHQMECPPSCGVMGGNSLSYWGLDTRRMEVKTEFVQGIAPAILSVIEPRQTGPIYERSRYM
jgi:hypothetical protein